MELANSARRGVAWGSLSMAASALLSLAQIAFAARLLEREDFGVMAMMMIVVGFSDKLADFGTTNAILHFQGAKAPVLASVFWANLLLGVVLCLLVAASAPLFAGLWGAPALGAWLPIASLVFVLNGLGQVSAALLRRELRFRRVATIDLTRSGASLAAVVSLALAGAGLGALVAGFLVSAGVRSALSLWAARRLFRPRLYFQRSDLAGFLRFGAYQVGERLVNFASWNVDKFLIGLWLGAEMLGVYTLAYQLMIRPFHFISTLAGRVTGPLLARVQADHGRLLDAYFTTLRLVAFVAVPVYVGAFLVAEPLVALVYGPGMGDVAAVFRILWPLGLLYALGHCDGALVIATGRARLSFLWNCFAAAVLLVAVLVGARAGLDGVAWALLVATGALLFPASFAMRRALASLRVRDYLACLTRPLLYGGLMAAAVAALASPLAGLPDESRLFGLAAVGALVYGALVLARERPLLLELRGS